MIVRIQQFPLIDAERFAAWPVDGIAAPIRMPFAPGTNAFELSVLEKDEAGRAVPMERRHAHLRALVAPLAEGLKENDSSIVVRLDGPISPAELVSAFQYLTNGVGTGRFAFDGAEKLDSIADQPARGSVRIEAGGAALAAICNDPQLGIDRGVRMRVFCVPRELVNPLLDTADLRDERWPDILPAAHFVMQNTHGLDALHVMSRLGADELSKRISGQLGVGG